MPENPRENIGFFAARQHEYAKFFGFFQKLRKNILRLDGSLHKKPTDRPRDARAEKGQQKLSLRTEKPLQPDTQDNNQSRPSRATSFHYAT